MGDITELLGRARSGDSGAGAELFARVHDELLRLAHSKISRESPITLLHAASLLNETYLRLAGQSVLPGANRQAFFAYAAQVMRSVMVSYVRNNRAQKRGGYDVRVTLTAANLAEALREPELEALDLALDSLAKVDLRAMQVVEMRYFAGLSIDEIAAAMDLSPATVKRSWRVARALLYKSLRE